MSLMSENSKNFSFTKGLRDLHDTSAWQAVNKRVVWEPKVFTSVEKGYEWYNEEVKPFISSTNKYVKALLLGGAGAIEEVARRATMDAVGAVFDNAAAAAIFSISDKAKAKEMGESIKSIRRRTIRGVADYEKKEKGEESGDEALAADGQEESNQRAKEEEMKELEERQLTIKNTVGKESHDAVMLRSGELYAAIIKAFKGVEIKINIGNCKFISKKNITQLNDIEGNAGEAWKV